MKGNNEPVAASSAQTSSRVSDSANNADRSLLHRLARRQDEATPPRVYRALTAEERREAALAFLEQEEDGREWLVPEVARAVNFRPQMVESWSNEKVAKNVTAVRFHTLAERARDFLVHLHLHTERRQMLAAFLDALGVEHDQGELPDSTVLAEVDRDTVFGAADSLLEQYDRDKVLVYFLTFLALQEPDLDGLVEWIRHQSDSEPDFSPEEAPYDSEETEASLRSFDAIDEFTTLDQQLVYAVIETAQRVQGAASEDELDDLIEEVIQLNRSRQRSYFHAGFRDAVFEREIPRLEREMNEQRARWYWSGVVNGLARRKAWDEIVEWYDADTMVKTLGDTGQGPSFAAGQLVLLALCRTGRAAEAAEFLKPNAVIHCERIFMTAFLEASQLLREDRAADARGLLERLGQAIEMMEAKGIEPGPRLSLEVRRRRAHCYRQLKEFSRAKTLLNRLREDEPDPDLLSMILADLGLIEGGFRNLADIRLPSRESGLADLASRLEGGRQYYEESVALGTEHGAHARFALGMLDLANRDFASAADRLELARSVFVAEPKRYGSGGLLARVDLALGVALACDLRETRMQVARDLIVGAMRQGTELPAWAVTPTLGAFGAHSEDLAQQTAAAMVEHSALDLLDRVVEASAAAVSPAVTKALLDRARDSDRGTAKRVADYRRAIPGLIQDGWHEEAGEALDFLENAALAGEGDRDFVALLEDPTNYEPVWDRDDALWARLHCLESTGAYEEAARLASEAFHRLLVEPVDHRVAQAADLLDRVKEYGLPSEFSEGLDARLDAVVREDGETESPSGPIEAEVRILFVGGNETQTQYDDVIVSELGESHPNVSVSFIHPGWDSNWIRYYEDAERKLHSHDGLVVMRFIRTQFGRRLRKLASETEKPWWSCAGSGKRSIKASILAAARVAQERARQRVMGAQD